jgi:hypothetical protein
MLRVLDSPPLLTPSAANLFGDNFYHHYWETKLRRLHRSVALVKIREMRFTSVCISIQ